MRRRVIQLLLVALAAAAAGCGTSSDSATHAALSALSVTTPSITEPPTAGCTLHGPLTASLRPPASLPPPGAMPANSFMARIRHRGYLIAGVNAGFLRFAYLNPSSGQINGFEIDLVRQLAKAIFGNPAGHIQLWALTADQRIPYVQHGKVDIVVDNVTINCGRRQQVDFSTVYFDAKQRILVPKGSPIHGIRDLAGKRVCATENTPPLDLIKRKQPRAVRVGLKQALDCLVYLQQDRVDAISTDDSILNGFTLQDPNTTILRPSLAPVPYGMAISKAHPGFVRFVNGVLAQIRANGTWRSIYSKWLGKFGPTPDPPAAQYQ